MNEASLRARPQSECINLGKRHQNYHLTADVLNARKKSVEPIESIQSTCNIHCTVMKNSQRTSLTLGPDESKGLVSLKVKRCN